MIGAIWTQNYTPIGDSVWLSALVALVPIIFFLVTLGVLRWKAHVAGFCTAVLSAIIAILVFKMPVASAVMAGVNGFLYGLWPIAWIIICAVFLYKLSVNSGQFDIIRDSILSITEDQRILVILVGFCFGSFLEGAAGFGAPVAIAAALLAGIGLKPLYAAGLCLVANSAPVCFGALGVPIITAGSVTGIDATLIGQQAANQLAILSLVVPLFIVFLMDGLRGIRECWPAAIVAGVSFAAAQLVSAHVFGPQLPSIISAVVSLLCMVVLLRVWKPKHIYTIEEAAKEAGEEVNAGALADLQHHSAGTIVRAWSPFLLLIVFVVIWTNKGFKALFAPAADGVAAGPLASTVLTFKMPGLHEMVQQAQPIGDAVLPAVFKLDILSGTGTAIFLAAIATVFVYGMGASKAIDTFKETVNEMKWAIVNIGCVLAFAYVMNFSGMASTMALALASTGVLFPFISPLIGWVGVFLTGSDTSANALFCGLQATTANQVGVSDILLVAANSSGGVTGKMISPQSMAIACAAVGMVGKESELLRYTIRFSFLFALLICIVNGLFAYVLPFAVIG